MMKHKGQMDIPSPTIDDAGEGIAIGSSPTPITARSPDSAPPTSSTSLPAIAKLLTILKSNILHSKIKKATTKKSQNDDEAEYNHFPSEILPNTLYLGSLDHATDIQSLTKLGITHILNVSGFSNAFDSEPHSKHMNRSYAHLDTLRHLHDFRPFVYLSHDIRDVSSEEIMDIFESCHEFISDAISESNNNINNKILVHCAAGVSRSPTITISYLMRHHQYTLDGAYAYIVHRRPMIKPNVGFLKQLVKYHYGIGCGPAGCKKMRAHLAGRVVYELTKRFGWDVGVSLVKSVEEVRVVVAEWMEMDKTLALEVVLRCLLGMKAGLECLETVIVVLNEVIEGTDENKELVMDILGRLVREERGMTLGKAPGSQFVTVWKTLVKELGIDAREVLHEKAGHSCLFNDALLK